MLWSALGAQQWLIRAIFGKTKDAVGGLSLSVNSPAGISWGEIGGNSTLNPFVARMPRIGSSVDEGSAAFAKDRYALRADGVSWSRSSCARAASRRAGHTTSGRSAMIISPREMGRVAIAPSPLSGMACTRMDGWADVGLEGEADG